jgi:hypothetical protein
MEGSHAGAIDRGRRKGLDKKDGKKKGANCMYPPRWLLNGPATPDLIAKRKGMDVWGIT